jgi:RNA polymerase II elongation factor ELL
VQKYVSILSCKVKSDWKTDYSFRTTHIKDTSSLPPANQKRGPAQPIKAGGKARFLAGSQKGSNASMPSSPALSGVGSPALAPTSVPLSQQQAERAKAIRIPLIHQLAIGPASKLSLLELKPSDVTDQEFKLAIEKVSDMVGERYELKQKAWKDLDVFKHRYKSEEDRQAVINSAIRVYDKLRLNSSEPEWDRLLPFSERGRGKCLSKLQSKIAVGAAMPPAKPKAKRSQNDSGRDSEGVDELFGNDTPKAKTDKMVKSKKDETLKDKRALAKASVGVKAAPAKAAAKKAVAKPKPKETGNFKSSQFVSDSDEEEETEPIRSKPASSSASLKQQSSAKSITKTTSTKRAADEMVDTRAAKKLKEAASSSSTKTSTQQRTSDSSSSSTKDSSSRPMKTATGAKRTTSPTKSSPLASSPPTNASEIGHVTGQSSSSVSPGSDSSHNDNKRKLDSDSSTEETRNRCKISKKAVTAAEMQGNYDDSQFNHVPSQDAIELALRYESLYDDYIKLYDEIQKDEQKKMQEYGRFMVMHGQMTEMKRTLIQMSRDPTEDMSDGAGASS